MEGHVMNRKDAGFTLIEAVVVMAITALLVTIGLPAFRDTLSRTRAISVMHLVSTDLAVARTAAIQRRAPIVVCPRDPTDQCHAAADWSLGWLVFLDPDGNRQPDAAGDILRVQNAPQPDAIRMPSSRLFVRYQPDGRSAGTNLTIHVCTRERLLGNVVVNNLGRVRTAKPKQEAPCPR
jgi:type IV fimbrial biogenesis protein FimT